jgi:uncharacterized protein (TIGR02246 family)
MLRCVRVVAIGALVVAATLPAQQIRQQGDRTAAARVAIDRAWNTILELGRKSDAAGMASLYASDAMLIDTGLPTLNGRAAIEKALHDLFATSRFVGMTHEQDALTVDGDIAVETGIISPTWQENGKIPVTTRERYTVVWKRVGGNWLILRDVGTPLPDAGQLTESHRVALADTIRSLGDSIFAAGNVKDLDGLFRYFDPSVSFLDNGAFIPSWEKHKEGARPFYRSLKSVHFEPMDVRVEVLSPDVVVWSGRYRYANVDSLGVTASGTNGQTWVFVRENVGWRVRHIHISTPVALR